jgi:hypothetical protein
MRGRGVKREKEKEGEGDEGGKRRRMLVSGSSSEDRLLPGRSKVEKGGKKTEEKGTNSVRLKRADLLGIKVG